MYIEQAKRISTTISSSEVTEAMLTLLLKIAKSVRDPTPHTDPTPTFFKTERVHPLKFNPVKWVFRTPKCKGDVLTFLKPMFRVIHRSCYGSTIAATKRMLDGISGQGLFGLPERGILVPEVESLDNLKLRQAKIEELTHNTVYSYKLETLRNLFK